MAKVIDVEQAAKIIATGGIVAYPTEAVYGLGCNPLNTSAVQTVLDLKSRPQDKGLILIAANWQQIEPFIAPINEQQRQSVDATWPGPVTWVMPANSSCNPILTGGRSTIAVRITAHPLVIELCKRCGHALVSTSANTSGLPAITDADKLASTFGSRLDGIVEGELGDQKKPSRIFDLQSGKQLR